MKTILAVEKSEYSRCLDRVINYKLPEQERQQAYDMMQELEQKAKDMGDELQIIITSKNTPRPLETAPAMT